MQRYMTRGMTNGGMVQARGDEALTLDQIRATVPSIFQTEAHESRSARFAPIPTSMVLEGLMKEGFQPFFAQQAKTRVPGKAEFTKHMLRMRHRGRANDNGDAFEVILINANDGTSAYNLMPGYFRFVCTNGLFTGEKFEDVKVRHSGNAVDEVIEGSYRVLDNAAQIVDTTRRWRGIELKHQEQEVMAEAAHMLRFPEAYEPADPDSPTLPQAPITVEALLRPRRYSDNGRDLWTSFNVVQENVIKGGLSGRVQTREGRMRRSTTREVKGIDQNKALNRALWMLGERMAELKTGVAA